jgi:hypothetical protein
MAAMGEVPDIARHVVATCSSHPILPILAPKTVLPGLFKVAFDFIIINYKPLAWYDPILHYIYRTWRNGVLEHWNNIWMRKETIFLQHSNTPLLHHSNLFF